MLPVGSSDFLRACRGLPVDRTPVWFMRQAGRSLPEYRAVREGIAMLDACARPDLVTEITMQPVRRYGVDAAVLYSDIVVPLHAAGVDVRIDAGVGPVLAHPIRSAADVDALPILDPEAMSAVGDAVRLLVAELGHVPLIGFAGAPFTLASYLIEGGPSRHHERTKSLMIADPGLWDALLSRIADIAATALIVQIDAGVSAVQLFDSWAGALSLADYDTYAAPYSARVLSAVAAHAGVPRIHFGVGTGELLGSMAAAGADVMGVDFHLPLGVAAARIAAAVGSRPVQGNLDPALVLAPWRALAPRVDQMLAEGAGLPGYIANLGHGVLPQTDPDQLARIVDRVHAFEA